MAPPKRNLRSRRGTVASHFSKARCSRSPSTSVRLAKKFFPPGHFFLACAHRDCILRKVSLLRAIGERESLEEDERKKLSTVSLPAQIPARSISTAKTRAKLTLWPLVAATFFM